jgi:hypothetical protein
LDVRVPLPLAPVVVRRSRVQGRGVFAAAPIRKGTRILEYTGARISAAEADADANDDDPTTRHHTFLFFVSDDVVIDGSRDGNEARFINHSCDPNCEIEISRNRVYIHALRRIAADEELSYDYWYITDETYSMEDLRRIYPCRCGADACRGTLARPPPRKRRRSNGIAAEKDACR